MSEAPASRAARTARDAVRELCETTLGGTGYATAPEAVEALAHLVRALADLPQALEQIGGALLAIQADHALATPDGADPATLVSHLMERLAEHGRDLAETAADLADLRRSAARLTHT